MRQKAEPGLEERRSDDSISTKWRISGPSLLTSRHAVIKLIHHRNWFAYLGCTGKE